jgi:hypothetical protein
MPPRRHRGRAARPSVQAPSAQTTGPTSPRSLRPGIVKWQPAWRGGDKEISGQQKARGSDDGEQRPGLGPDASPGAAPCRSPDRDDNQTRRQQEKHSGHERQRHPRYLQIRLKRGGPDPSCRQQEKPRQGAAQQSEWNRHRSRVAPVAGAQAQRPHLRRSGRGQPILAGSGTREAARKGAAVRRDC